MGFLDGIMGQIPGPAVISQLLRASGVKDPKVFAMIDALVAGGFTPPQIAAIGEEGFYLDEDDNAIMVRTSNHDEELVLVLLRRKVSGKVLPSVIHTQELTPKSG